jgi:hypothetical protein
VTADAYPLHWPHGWKRTDPHRRREAKFGRASRRYSDGSGYVPGRALNVTEAVDRLCEELVRMAVDLRTVVISTNVEPTLRPRSGQRKPDDPGAAVYWKDSFNGKPRAMAIDQYTRVEDNIAALAATIEAMRAIERHGGALIVERAFEGFIALPAPGGTVAREWWDVLGIPRTASRDEIRAAYRRLASDLHSDKGGNDAAMAELNVARDRALEACA